MNLSLSNKIYLWEKYENMIFAEAHAKLFFLLF